MPRTRLCLLATILLALVSASPVVGEAGPPVSVRPDDTVLYRQALDAAALERIELPQVKRPLPKPLPPDRSPGFAHRGIKGWHWTPQQYRDVVPMLARHKMNFLMVCYTSMYSHYPEMKNEWWRPLPDEMRHEYESVIRECARHSIDFCMSIHPQLHAPRPMNPASDEDFDRLWQHFEWAVKQGVRWHSLTLDDVQHPGMTTGKPEISGEQHALLANRLLERLRSADARAELILCPTWYWGGGANPTHRSYLRALAERMHPDVYVFWTGPEVVCAAITANSAREYRALVEHRLFVWDNYPVNDSEPTLHLGPLRGRDAELSQVAVGYISNPLKTQTEISRLPILTMADWMYSPQDYDPADSIGQAILCMGETYAQREVLRRLVELYPGVLQRPAGTYATDWMPRQNPALARFRGLMGAGDVQLAGVYADYVTRVAADLDRCFPGRFKGAQATLAENVVTMGKELEAE